MDLEGIAATVGRVVERVGGSRRGPADSAWPSFPRRPPGGCARPVGLPERHGLLVRAVQGGSPAGLAGLREGDLLVEAGGRPLRVVDDLLEAVDALPPGEALRLRVVRGVEEPDLEIRLDGPVAGEA